MGKDVQAANLDAIVEENTVFDEGAGLESSPHAAPNASGLKADVLLQQNAKLGSLIVSQSSC